MEVLVRVLNMHEPLLWTPDPVLGWKAIPDATRLYTEEGHSWVEINELGYRDRQRQLKKTQGTIRIGVFGDSQTEAIQVNLEHTYVYLLEEMLTSEEQPVEVLSFGVSGYSPTQELLSMKNEIERYDLDLIVVALFFDNDVSGSIPELSVSTSGTPFLIAKENSPAEFDYSRAEESHADFFRQPKYTIRKYSGIYRFLFKLKNSWGQCGEYCQTTSIPTRYKLYLQNPDDQWSHAWRVFERTLGEIKQLSVKTNIPLVFSSIPAGQTVSEEAWNNLLTLNPEMENQSWDLFGAEKRLASIAESMDIPLVQPYKIFLEKAQSTTLYFGDVGHLTHTGHEEFAKSALPLLQMAVTNKKSN